MVSKENGKGMDRTLEYVVLETNWPRNTDVHGPFFLSYSLHSSNTISMVS